MTDPNTKPWYSEEEKLIESFDEKMTLLTGLCVNHSLAGAEILAMEEMQIVRTIYESNLIEGAGLSSEGATKKLIDEYFPKIPSEPVKTSSIKDDILDQAISSSRVQDFFQFSEQYGLSSEVTRNITVSVQFAGKSKEISEVLCHRIAIQSMYGFVFETKKAGMQNLLDAKKKTVPLFSEERLKKLHRELADGLLPNDCTVSAGEYRNDNRFVDHVRFPTPELLNDCMKKWVEDSNILIEDLIHRKIHPIRAAAKISYDFVMIHPFPDFNGRMSRLIMNMVLTGAGLPFLIDLRGNGKNKKRYFTALQHANRGKITSLSALIALRGNEILDETLENLRKAGCKVTVPSSS